MTKKILMSLAVIVVILIGASFFLPSKWHVRRSIVIAAAPEAIFPWVDNIRRWPDWTPWTEDLDPTMKRTFEGPEAGIGAKQSWQGTKMGNGTLTIIESSPPEKIVYDLNMDNGKFMAKGGFTFKPTTDGTEVTWFDSGELPGDPVSKYFGLMMDSMIGSDFEKGLQKLKLKAEVTVANQQAQPTPTAGASAKTTP